MNGDQGFWCGKGKMGSRSLPLQICRRLEALVPSHHKGEGKGVRHKARKISAQNIKIFQLELCAMVWILSIPGEDLNTEGASPQCSESDFQFLESRALFKDRHLLPPLRSC